MLLGKIGPAAEQQRSFNTRYTHVTGAQRHGNHTSPHPLIFDNHLIKTGRFQSSH